MFDLDSLPVESSPVTSSQPTNQTKRTRFTYSVADVVRIVIVTILALLALVIIIGVLAGQNHNFTSPINIRNLLIQVGVYGLVAVGMTFVILNRGIDLSVGPMAALAGILAATAYNNTQNLGAAISIALTVGLIGGFVQGLIIAVLGIPSYIVTLGGAALFTSLALQASDGKLIVINGDDYRALAAGTPGSIPPLFAIFLVAALLAQVIQIISYFVVRRMPGLNSAASTGSESPGLTAIIVVAVGKIATYTLMGVLAALSGVFLTSRLSAATPSVGIDWALITVAAVVIGGTSVFSGKGWFVGTFIGLLIVGVLQNGGALLGVSSFVSSQGIVIALVIALILNRVIEMLVTWFARSSSALSKPVG